MAEISGEMPPINPADRKVYEQEYKQGVNLFQRALNEYEKAGEMNKKQAFKEVMDRAMQVMNDAAQALHRADLEKQNAQINQDYQAYQDGNSKAPLEQDLKNAKGSF